MSLMTNEPNDLPSANLPLKSVDDYNAHRRTERQERERRFRMTGVACPKCGGELLWTTTYVITGQYPPPTCQPAECKRCRIIVQLEK